MARPKGIWTPEVVRKRIQTTKLVQRLKDHIDGTVEMSVTQLKAAIFLIERIVPRAEAPKQLDITGRISLENLISGALTEGHDDRPRPSSH